MKKQFFSLFYKLMKQGKTAGSFFNFDIYSPKHGVWIVSKERYNVCYDKDCNEVDLAESIYGRMLDIPNSVVGFWYNPDNEVWEIDVNHVLPVEDWSENNVRYLAKYENQHSYGLLLPDGTFYERTVK